MEVPSTYVDSFRSGELELLSALKDRQLTLGMPVIVTSGKDQGKQGIISAIRRWTVVVTEDQSDIQVINLIIKI